MILTDLLRIYRFGPADWLGYILEVLGFGLGRNFVCFSIFSHVSTFSVAQASLDLPLDHHLASDS